MGGSASVFGPGVADVVNVLAELQWADSELLLEGFREMRQILESALAGDLGERDVLCRDDASGIIESHLQDIGDRSQSGDGHNARAQLLAAERERCGNMLHVDVILNHLGMDDINEFVDELLVFFITLRRWLVVIEFIALADEPLTQCGLFIDQVFCQDTQFA